MAIFFNQATLSYNGNVTNSNVTSGEILETITFTKESISTNYSRGEAVTYVLTVTNAGAEPLTGLTVTDNLGEYIFGSLNLYPLEYVAGSLRVYVNGILYTTATVDAGPPLVIGGIDIPAGGNAVIVYEAVANEFAPVAPGSTITNLATLGCGEADEAVVPVDEEPVLSITKFVCPDTVSCSSPLTYTFVLQNTGNREVVATDDVIVSDVFTPALSDITVTYNGTVWTEGVNYEYNPLTGEFTTLPGQITIPPATFTQNPTTGVFETTPGVGVLEITGKI
jgi:uncharacterized repeat protein (TIGR01451 family)